ncbi:MAG: ParB/RepB/Spo0J family partition protein [Clostridia bacterium]|nr:ParB/RepB/Spo0J family partition protein [Clostridia bacterium]
MLNKKGGLGKGLDALFTDNSIEEVENGGAVEIRLTEIEPDRNQPRKVFDEEALAQLSESILQNGLIQPLLVRPIEGGGYQLVAGERRWRASRMAGLTKVPVIVKNLTDEEAMTIALIENLQREDLNAIEEARGIQRLIKELGLTQEEAAVRLQKSRPAIANSLRLLALPDEVLNLISKDLISAGHARALLSLETKTMMCELAARIVRDDLSVRQTEEIVKTFREKPKKKPTQKRNKFFDEVELALEKTLGRKVKVKNRSAQKGSIEIEFFSADDLQKLVKAFDEK